MAMAAPLMVGCSDDTGINDGGVGAFGPGDEILFGGMMTFDSSSSAKTRTVYGDEGKNSSNKNATEIRWYEGDKVRIYCGQAGGGQTYSDYIVQDYVAKGVTPTDGKFETYDSTRLAPLYGTGSGLKWGDETTHTFYAAYPSPTMFAEGGEVPRNYTLDSNILKGYLPTSQSPSQYLAPVKGTKTVTSKYGNGTVYTPKTYTIHPAMRYAYMVGKSTAAPADGYVDLTFNPVVTAVEFTLINDCFTKSTSVNGGATTVSTIEQPIEDISLVTIYSDGVTLSGNFETNIDSETTNVTNGHDYVSMPIQDENGYPVTLEPYDTLRFTVFMLPSNGSEDTDLTKLKIRVQTGLTFKTATLTGKVTDSQSDIIVQAKKKNFISNIKLAWDVNTNYSNWMSQLPGDMILGDLSIPGAGGAGSHTMAEGYNQQTLNIGELWKRGVRCFEFFTDIINGSNSSLKNAYLVCNGQYNDELTLGNAIAQIQDSLEANPREFAIVTIGYQTADQTRNATNWQQAFNTYWSEVEGWSYTSDELNDAGTKIVCQASLLDPSTKLDDARGKLFCILRPTGIGYDPWWYTMNRIPKTAYAVLGWGASTDNFYARGYDRTNRPYYINQTGTFEKKPETTGGTLYMYPSYRGVQEATEAFTLNSKNVGTNYYTASADFVTHLQPSVWGGTTATADDKFLYPLASHTSFRWATMFCMEDIDSKRAYVQDWRRVANGDFATSGSTIGGTSVAPEPSYKVYVKPNITHGYSNGSLSITSVSVNGSDPITDPNDDGYYVYDFREEYTNSFDITLKYTYKTGYSNSTRSRTKTETVTDGVKSDLYITFDVTSTTDDTGNGSLGITSTGSSSSSTYYYYWPDSKQEKLKDIVEALEKSTHAEDRDRTFYINSLSGFFITENEKSYKPYPLRLAFINVKETNNTQYANNSGSSNTYGFNDSKYNGVTVNENDEKITIADYYTDDSNMGAYHKFGGTYGDISGFAAWINQEFYAKLLQIGADNLAGPTGIIITDRITNKIDSDSDKPGYYITQIIVANNFKWANANDDATDDELGTGGGDDAGQAAAPRDGKLIWR